MLNTHNATLVHLRAAGTLINKGQVVPLTQHKSAFLGSTVTCFRKIHSSYDRLRLSVHVHKGCVQLAVSPVQETLHHLLALRGVSPATKRHRPQDGNRTFVRAQGHVSTSHKPR